jgi:hypothetical protein
MGAQGTAVIDFGAIPAEEASVVVSGQTGILSGSHAEAFWMGDANGDNDADAHEQMADFCRLVVGDVVAGASFTIKAHLQCGLATGQFNIRWVWN